jgi:hypothetical protein
MDHEVVLSASTRRFRLCIKLSNREFCNQVPAIGVCYETLRVDANEGCDAIHGCVAGFALKMPLKLSRY